MLDKFIHVNSKGETLDLLALGIYANENELRNYEWTVNTSNDKIVGFKKGVVKKSVPFVFFVDKERAAEIKNKFYEHFDVDVLTARAGHFIINGYKYTCYLTKSVKSDYLTSKRQLKLTAEVTTDKPYWCKETLRTIDFSTTQTEGKNSLTYPFTYPFTYTNEKVSKIVNEDFIESDAIIRMYGAAEDPLVKINDNVYQINTSLGSTEYLEINTSEKTIVKYDNKGNATNLFHLRSKNGDSFKKVPPGALTVSANGNYRVDVVLIEKRGEPRWV